MVMVESMVQNYMKNPRRIMLAVVPANVDIATQEILEKAEDVDPEGTRTLGVLTKPDLVDKGAEKDVIDLVEGRTHQLKPRLARAPQRWSSRPSEAYHRTSSHRKRFLRAEGAMERIGER